MAEPLRLYGLNALVLNAGGGIGEAIARTLVKHGATVLAVDQPRSGVVQLFEKVKGVTGFEAPLNDPDKLPALVEQTVSQLGGLDILVNDFPLRPDAPLAGTGEQFDRLLHSRAVLVMAVSRAALPHLGKSPAGRIINVGFLRSHFAADGGEARTRAEQDLANLTRALAVETGASGITANYIQPGAVMTPEAREVFRKDKDLRDHCIRASAAKRLGEPVDIAKVALFLASDDAVFVSGTGIAVDGGRTDAD